MADAESVWSRREIFVSSCAEYVECLYIVGVCQGRSGGESDISCYCWYEAGLCDVNVFFYVYMDGVVRYMNAQG